MATKIECRRLIGQGSFGRVFESLLDGERFAIKVESQDVKTPQLAYEYRVLRDLKGLLGIPAAYHAWKQPCGEMWMVIQLLGKSLEKHRPNMDELLRLAPIYIRILEGIHNKGYLHRDIKPENMLRGFSGSTYWLVDFGLAKKYIHSDGRHLKPLTNKPVVGTPRYVSRHVHAGCQSSRRDDLESLGYSLVYLANDGRLPWITKKTDLTRDEKIRQIAECKANTPVKKLCTGMPKAFELFMSTVRDLEFEETPDYGILVGFFEV